MASSHIDMKLQNPVDDLTTFQFDELKTPKTPEEKAQILAAVR